MDEDFALFLAKFGPAIDKRHVPPSTMDRYRGKLPDQLLGVLARIWLVRLCGWIVLDRESPGL
jgi:hypothetical protein